MTVRIDLPRIDLGEPGVVCLAEISARLDRPQEAVTIRLDDSFVFPGAYAALEGMRRRLERVGQHIRIEAAIQPMRVRPFADVIGFGRPGSGSATTIPIHVFELSTRDRVGPYLMNVWAKRAESLTTAHVERIVSTVAEIFENALTHAHSDAGVISCGQYFEKTQWLHLSVVDLGIGTPASLAAASHRREHEVDAARAIAWAFEPGHSSVRASRGLGLWILHDFLRQARAKLNVYSGRGFARLHEGRWETGSLKTRFPGTLVELAIPVAA